MKTSREWIEELKLGPHPEGGWFRECYRAPLQVSAPGFTNPRPASTAIYYLLESGNFSALHRLRQDEVWHFYAGSSLTIHMITDDNTYLPVTLKADGKHQFTVKSGTLFGATVDDSGSFALVGCTVAPGFDYSDLEIPTRDELLAKYPEHHNLILRLTR